MSQDWAVVVAALGSSALTILGSFWLLSHQHKLEQKDANKQSKTVAYASLLSLSSRFITRMHQLLEAKRVRSGLLHAILFISYHYEPFDIKDIYDWIKPDLDAFGESISTIKLIGSLESMEKANKLVEIAWKIMAEVENLENIEKSFRSKWIEMKWTKEAQNHFVELIKEFGDSRQEFINLARKELGAGAISFVDNSQIESPHNTQPPTQPPL